MAGNGIGDADGDKTVGKAAFLGGLLAFASVAALSIVGVGHARSLEGAANPQYWIVVAIAAAVIGWVTLSLARTPARTRPGEVARRVAVALAAMWLVVFLWETTAVGTDRFSGPFELAYAAMKR